MHLSFPFRSYGSFLSLIINGSLPLVPTFSWWAFRDVKKQVLHAFKYDFWWIPHPRWNDTLVSDGLCKIRPQCSQGRATIYIIIDEFEINHQELCIHGIFWIPYSWKTPWVWCIPNALLLTHWNLKGHSFCKEYNSCGPGATGRLVYVMSHEHSWSVWTLRTSYLVVTTLISSVAWELGTPLIKSLS